MSLIRKFLDRIGQPARNPEAKQVMTPWGPVSEGARLAVCQNMIEDPACKVMVERMLIDLCGGDTQRGLAEARARYPEAYL